METIGGGEVLDCYPKRHKRSQADLADDILLLKKKDPEKLIPYFARTEGTKGISFRDLSCRVNLPRAELDKQLSRILSEKELIQYDQSQTYD